MSVKMTSTKNYMNELFGTLLVLSALSSTAFAVDCHGKSFHCVNSTHFMICVDLGGGVSQAIDNFYIACPPPTVCQGTNHFECEFPAPTTPSTVRSNVISETTLPWEDIVTSSSLDNTTKEFSENYINTDRATTVEYSVTIETTADVTTRTASNFYINNELNVTKIAPTIVADITTSPIETISQTISKDRSITKTILPAEGVTTSVIETVTETTAETNNPTKTDLVIAGEENNKKAININTQTTTENKVITETVTAESVPITIEQIIQTTVNPLEVDTSYNEHGYTSNFGKWVVPLVGDNNAKQKNYTMDAQNAKDTTTLDKAFTIDTVGNAPRSEHPTTIYEEIFTKDSIQNTEIVNLDIVTTEAIPSSNVQLGTTQAPSLTLSSADTTTVDETYTIETVEKVPTSEHPPTIYEENLTKDSTQNIETVNLDIATTEAVNISYSNSDVQLVTTQAPSLTQSSADTTTLDKAFTIDTVGNAPRSEQPTTIYEENFTKDTTQNIETVNLDIVTTEAINIPLSNSDDQQVTTDAPSLTQSVTYTTTRDGAFNIETVENAPSSEQPTTVNEEKFIKDSTQNIETVNVDIVTTEAAHIPFLNGDDQLVMTQAPSLSQNFADTTTLDGAFTVEIVENAPSSEQPTTVNKEKFTKESTQNIETVNLDIVTTEAVNIPFSYSDVQLVTTQAPSLTQSSADTTTINGAYTIETVENAPSSKHPTTIYEENFTKDTTQNIETVNLDIVTTEAINIPLSNSDDQQVTTDAPSLTQSVTYTTTRDGAFNIETVENAPSSEQPTTVNEEKFIKDSTQNIETVNVDIVTTEAAHIPFLNGDDQLVMTQAPSLSQNFADTTTLDGAFTVEIVENAPSSEQPTTVNKEKFTKESTQNIETVNLDIVTTEAVNIPFSYSDVQLVTTQAPSLTQSSADTTTINGAYTIETVENAPSSKHPTTIYEENFTKDTTQNIETVNLDIVTTEAINIPLSNSDDQQVTTDAPSLTQSVTYTTTRDGAFNIETVENAPSSEQPTTVNEEKFIKDSTQNIETVNVDIVTTEAAHIPFLNGDDQLVMTQAPSLTQSSADTNLDRVFTIETVENSFISEQPTMINEQSSIDQSIDTTQNIVTENIIVPNSKAINRDIVTTETIYQSSTEIKDQLVMTEESHVTKITVDLHTSTEQTTMLHEENGTVETYENVASQKVPIATGYTQSVTLKPQNPEYVKQDVTMIAEIIENGAIKEQPITTNAKSSTTGIIQNVATDYNNIPTRHSVNFDITTEVVYTPTTIKNDHIIQVASEDYISTEAQLLTDTNVDETKVDEAFITGVVGNGDSSNQINLINKESVATDTTRSIDSINLPACNETVNVTTIISNAQSDFENNMKTEGLFLPSENIVSTPEVNGGADFIPAKPINIEQIIAKLPEEKLIPNAELEMAIVQITNNNYANADHDNDDFQQKNKTEFLGPKSESNDISIQTYNSQKGESKKIRVPNHAQYSKLQPSTIEGQDQTANIHWNPFDNYLIDKSFKKSELTEKSDVTNLNMERNDVNVVSSDSKFVSLQHVISALPATNPIPAEINNRKQSYNATTVTQSSDGFLITNGLPENIMNVNSESEVASLPTQEPVTLVKDHSTYLKTNTLANGGSVTLSSSKTVPTNANVADTKILYNKGHYVETIPNLFGPGSESIIDETGSNVKKIGSNANVSSDNKEIDNSKTSKEATVADTKILDNTHNIETIHNLFSTGSESTVDQTASNVREIASNADDSSDKIESENSKNSKVATVVETKLLDNIHNIEIIHNLFSSASESTVYQTGGNVREIGSNANISSDKKEFTSPKNSKDATIADTTILDNTRIIETTHTLFSPGLESTVYEIDSNVREIGSNANVFSHKTEPANPKYTDATVVHTKILDNTHNHDIIPILFSPRSEPTVDKTGSKVREIESNVNVSSDKNPKNSKGPVDLSKTNSPINLSLSISIQKPYAKTVQTLSQSVTANPISPVTKQVANEEAIPFTCVNGVRGRYSDKDHCRKFYICVGHNQPVVGNCPENTVFSDIKKLCTKNLSHCIRQNEFKCPSAGRFSDFMKDNVYYICVNHKNHLYRFKFQCQEGYIFNKTTVNCIEEIESNESVSITSSDNISQMGSTSTASTSNNISSDDSSSKTDDVSTTKNTNEAEETPEKSEGNEDDDEDEVFECKKEGKFPIRNECRRFYLCKKKRKSEYRRKIKKCGSDRVFHKDKKKCVDADSYEC
ncbi:mucin-3B-like [Cydia strobilella]|uniref:mucin-3B-like n=1 Tax=Cydia strobilella TaxID=1100964 RepID=UPI003004DAEA